MCLATLHIHTCARIILNSWAANWRIDQIIGLFCKRTLWKRRYSAKETTYIPVRGSYWIAEPPIEESEASSPCTTSPSTCDMTHSYVWRDSYICVTWLRYTSTHCITLQHTATHCNTLQHTWALHIVLGWIRIKEMHAHNKRVTPHIYVSHVTHICESCHTYESTPPFLAKSNIYILYASHMYKHAFHMHHMCINMHPICITHV